MYRAFGVQNTRNKIKENQIWTVDSRDQLPVINDQPSSQKQSHQEKEKKKKFLVSGFPKARNLFFLWFSCASFEVFCFLAFLVSPTPQSTDGSFKQEQLQKVPKLQATWDANRKQKPPKWNPKAFKMEAQTLQNRAQIKPRGSPGRPKNRKIT